MNDESKKPPPTGIEKLRLLRAQSERARRLAIRTLDARVAADLVRYANELDADASKREEQAKGVLTPQAMEASGEPDTTHAIAALKTEEPDES